MPLVDIEISINGSVLPDDVVVRIKLTKGDAEMQPDKIRPGDETFDHNGNIVLVLDQQTSQLLGNKIIDLMTDDDGSHLILV